MTRSNIEEDREDTMARFLESVNRDIQNVVKLQHYVELEDMAHMTIKIENQVKRRGSSNTRFAPSLSSSTWKSNQWMKDKKLITLVPLIPKQVYEDQVRLKQECD